MELADADVEPVVERRLLAISLSILTLLTAATLVADTMPLSQIQKGMRGYGVTVFEGNRLEKFDVEILGVLHNIGPRQDLILAKIDSPMVQRAGVIAGMSGSPVYLDGKVIGALAYSWQFAKEPVAGITPIEEMLKIAQVGKSNAAAVVAAAPRMSGAEFLNTLANQKAPEVFDKLAGAIPASASGAIHARPNLEGRPHPRVVPAGPGHRHHGRDGGESGHDSGRSDRRGGRSGTDLSRQYHPALGSLASDSGDGRRQRRGQCPTR